MKEKVELLVKIRDGYLQIVDAINTYLEIIAPANVNDYNLLKWRTVEGSLAPYEQTIGEDNQANIGLFKNLQRLLTKHKGFWQHRNHKYWFHSGDPNVIDRRQKS